MMKAIDRFTEIQNKCDALCRNSKLSVAESYSRRMKLDEERAEFLKSVAKQVISHFSWEHIRKMWFIDYGTTNRWDARTSLKFNIARELHTIDASANGHLHKKLPQKYNWNCWHEENCSCGFCHSCDSGD